MPEHTALLIIDVQRGYINDHTRAIPALVEQKQHDYDLVWVAKLSYEGSDSPFVTIRNTNGFSDVENPTELAFVPRDDAKVIQKHGYSAYTPELAGELLHKQVKQIDLAGIDTDQCVLATALALFDAKITPRVLTQYCASTAGRKMHDTGVLVLRRALGTQNILQ
jgi:nicotinamidase-related amidase